MSRETREGRVPDLLLERYWLGEMLPDERGQLERALEQNEELRRRLEELERSDAEIRRSHPPEWLAARVEERRPKPQPGRRRPFWAVAWPVPLAVAATVLAVFAPRLLGPPRPGPVPAAENGDRIKGLEPALSLHRKTVAGSELLAERALVRAGELVRIGYRSAGRPYGVIFSLDGRGAVTLHLPSGGERAARLHSGDTVLLDRAYELDDAPRWECFYLVTSETPFDVAPVLQAARHAALGGQAPPPRLALRPPLEQSVFTLLKGEGP
jgi:anti-sigma factor RsiW